MTNEFKSGFFQSPNQLIHHRLAVSQKQLTQFWFSKSLKQLQNILCIKDQYLVYQIIFQRYLNYYLTNKKIATGQFYYIMHKQKCYMYVYDAKIFRNQSFQKYQNDLISTFLIAYKQGQQTIQDDIFQFIDPNIIQKKQWIFKVKQSAILRIFPYLIHRLIGKKQNNFTSAHRNPIGGYFFSKQPQLSRQVIILQPINYSFYLYSRIPNYYIPQMTIKTLFDNLTQLIFNNLLYAWYNSLSKQQKYNKHFKKYFRLIPKPKHKQEFTSIQNKFTQIQSQSFQINVFKLKYLIKENQSEYQCYQIQSQNQQKLSQPYYDLSRDDENILKAFQKKKQYFSDYDKQYPKFFQSTTNKLSNQNNAQNLLGNTS